MPKRRKTPQKASEQREISALERRLEEMLRNYDQIKASGFPEHAFLLEHGINLSDKTPIQKELVKEITMREFGCGMDEWMSPLLEAFIDKIAGDDHDARVALVQLSRDRVLTGLFESIESRLGMALTPAERERIIEEIWLTESEEELRTAVAEIGWLEDKADFGALLALAESILANARRLADWAHNDQLDGTGATMLLRIGDQWLALESIVNANGFGAEEELWCTEDDAIGDDLACAVRKNVDWFKYLPNICDSDFLCLAPNACMGMPHAEFAKRLAVVVDLLRKATEGEARDDGPVPPKVFISYSWDDEDHKRWVREFAVRLRADGAEAILDQWAVVPGDRLPYFMEQAIRENSYVLIVCTPKYKEKSDSRKGGVGYEGDIMTAEVHTKGNHRKFISILRRGDRTTAVPLWLAGKYDIDLRGDPCSEENYGDLVRTLHNRREQAPPIGPAPGGPVPPEPDMAAVKKLWLKNSRLLERFRHRSCDDCGQPPTEPAEPKQVSDAG